MFPVASNATSSSARRLSANTRNASGVVADPALLADQPVLARSRPARTRGAHPFRCTACHHHRLSSIDRIWTWGTGGRNDTYGFALAAQPGKSQGRPTTNTGSQPTEQERPAHPRLLPDAPVPDGRTVIRRPSTPSQGRDASETGGVDTFIPGTNAIESLNARYRRAVKARGHFPTEQAALKCLYLVTRSLDPTGRGRARWTMRWKPALNAFAITFADRWPAAETY